MKITRLCPGHKGGAVPHVELSLTESAAPRQRPHRAGGSSLMRWAAAAAEADESCVVLAADATIVAVSVSAAALMGLGDPAVVAGLSLPEAADPLVDFTAAPARLDEVEARKVPPLLAISSGRIARGLIRVQCRHSGQATTLDAVSTPLTDDQAVVGSLTFFAQV